MKRIGRSGRRAESVAYCSSCSSKSGSWTTLSTMQLVVQSLASLVALVERVLDLAHFRGQVDHGDHLVDELPLVVVAGDQQVQFTRFLADEREELFEVPLAL